MNTIQNAFKSAFLSTYLVLSFSTPAQADSDKFVNPTNNHVYQYFDTGMFWGLAKDACAAQGGYLVTITSQDENDYLVSKGLIGTNYVWLGAKFSAGKWQWITGEKWTYTNWGLLESDRDHNMYNLLWVDRSGKWLSNFGDYLFSNYLCEWNSPINIYTGMITADTDNDGSTEFILTGSKGATVKVFGYDHATKAVVSDVSFLAYPAYTGISLSVMDDMNDNGYKEFALLMTKKADGSSVIQTRDSKTGALLESYKVPR